jgi:hypothetical protein
MDPDNLTLISHGMTREGHGYNYFPMPYWKSARIEVANKGGEARTLSYEIQYKPASAFRYPQRDCAHFHVRYRPRTAGGNTYVDFVVAEVEGSGHVVGGVITQHYNAGSSDEEEGDFHLYVDGNQSPRVQSDGSESWILYGPAFPGPGAGNVKGAAYSCPVSGYWGQTSPWSMTRLLAGGYYPYRTRFRFGIEHYTGSGGIYSGAVYYYGTDEPAMALTDVVDVGSLHSEKAHDYKVAGETRKGFLVSQYEGDWNIHSGDDGRSFSGSSEFTVKIAPENRGIRLRRKFDQANPGQRARVSVDGKPVAERNWYEPWQNSYLRWGEDEFDVPAGYTAGKSSVRIKIECIPLPEGRREYLDRKEAIPRVDEWNECRYWVFSHTR